MSLLGPFGPRQETMFGPEQEISPHLGPLFPAPCPPWGPRRRVSARAWERGRAEALRQCSGLGDTSRALKTWGGQSSLRLLAGKEEGNRRGGGGSSRTPLRPCCPSIATISAFFTLHLCFAWLCTVRMAGSPPLSSPEVVWIQCIYGRRWTARSGDQNGQPATQRIYVLRGSSTRA